MKNKKLLVIGGGTLLLITMFFGCGERSGEKEYNKAMASWRGGDLVRAQGQLEKAIRKLSGHEKKSVANNQLGIILWNLDKPDQAIAVFSESCRLAEQLTGANQNLGLALYHAGELEQAEFELTKILNEQPTNSIVRSALGMIKMQKKDWKSAAKEIASNLRTNPNNPAGQNALALTELHMNKNSDVAVKRLKQLVSAYPDYAPAAYNLAVIYDQWLPNNSAARGWYKQYLQKAGAEGAHADIAQQAIARLGGKVETTRRSPKKQTYPGAASKYITEGSKLHADKNYSEAVKLYEMAIQADPSQMTAYYNLSLSLYELKQYSKAAKACKDALNLDSGFANARYMLALSYAQQRKWNDAEREANILKQADVVRGESLLKYISAARNR